MIFWIGLQPRFFLDRMAPTLDDLMKPAMQAVEEEGKRGEWKRAERANCTIASIVRIRNRSQSSIINHQSSISVPAP